jgi:Xaa-Pro aminopeptidase
MMHRRDFLGAAGVAGAATLAGSVATAAAASTGSAPGPASIKIDNRHVHSDVTRKIPVDRARASGILEELGLDGLIALQPHNVFYLTNTRTTLTQFSDEYPAFATLPRDPQQPVFLISSLGNTWTTSNGDRDVPEIITFAGPANWQEYVGSPPDRMRVEPISIGPQYRHPVRPGASLTQREAGWKRDQDVYNTASAGSREWAVVHALQQSGLIKGKLAVDDMRIAYLLQRIGIDSVTIVPGEDVFRRIRHIKTEREVETLRIAQRITQESAMAAARALEPGMTFADFQLRLFAEGAARGGEPGFSLLGVTQGLLPDGVVKRGQSYLLDCSIHFDNYHGDFARTVMIGEPTAENLKRFKAQQLAREAAFEIIKPGVPFERVEQLARETALKAGMPEGVPVFGMHSVGLQHGDDPLRLDIPFGVRDKHVLAENMVVTLDLPYIEIGSGAGHNEDMLRITRNGYEILNDPAGALIVV